MTAHVQDSYANSKGAASVIVPVSSSLTSGNTVIGTFLLPVGASVASVVDNLNNPWIQASYSYAASVGGAEIWYSRGVKSGAASVTVTFTSAASVGANIAEYSGLYYADPLDQWSQNYGTSSTASVGPITPRAANDLFVGAVYGSASVGSGPSGWTALTESITNGAAYYFTTGSTSPRTPAWTFSSSASWAAVGACFQAGRAGVNSRLIFPEVLVEISLTNQYLNPINGYGTWTNISNYVLDMSIGPHGRQHELDRVQSSPLNLSVDNRSGTFDRWNTSSFLYGGGNGLMPMNPIKVTAAWNGITYPKYFGYLQEDAPQIQDVLNVNSTLHALDIFQVLSLKYHSNTNYEQQVILDGGANLEAFYELNGQPGNYFVTDYSGNGNTGSLISGPYGTPNYGSQGPFLFDANTALDLTNGSSQPNGGVTTVDNATQPPTQNDPLGGALSWSFECWYQWDGPAPAASVAARGSAPSMAAVPNGVLLHIGGSNYGLSEPTEMQLGVGYDDYGDPVANQVVWAFAGAGSESITTPLAVLPLFDGNWHHIVITQQFASATTALYFDGVFIANMNNVPVYEPTQITVGSPPSGTNGLDPVYGGSNYAQGVPGKIAHVAFYSTVISPLTVTQHYAIGNWFQTVAPGVVPYGTPSANYTTTSTSSASVGATTSITVGAGLAYQKGQVVSISHDVNNNMLAVVNSYRTKSGLLSYTPFSSSGSGTYSSWSVTLAVPPTGRLNNALQNIGLDPDTILNVPYQFLTYIYAEPSPVTTTSGLNYLQRLAQTEPGLIFQAPNGQINAYNRQYQYLAPTAITSQGYFADAASVAASVASTVYHYNKAITISGNDLDVWNDIQVQSARSGSTLQEWGPAQSSVATYSVSAYGPRTLQGLTSLQQQHDIDALAMAQNYAAWYNLPLVRVTHITLNSQTANGANLPQMLGRGLMDRVTVAYNNSSPSTPFQQDSLVEQITDTVNLSNPTWVTEWSLSPYEILVEPPLYMGNGSASVTAASVTSASVFTGYFTL